MHSFLLLLLALVVYLVVSVRILVRAGNRHPALTRASLVLISAGLTAHSASIVLRWVELERFPAVGPRDVVSWLAWVIVAAFVLLYLATRLAAPALAVFPAAFGLLLVACLAPVHERSAPWLRGLYLPAHTTFAFAGYAALFVAFAFGILYLIQERELKARVPRRFYYLAPSLERCDTLGARSVVVGLTFLTLAIISGFFWSHVVRGRYFSGNAKEWSAFFAWLIYAALVVARRRTGWGGRRAALLGIAGFVVVLFVFLWSILAGETGGAVS